MPSQMETTAKALSAYLDDEISLHEAISAIASPVTAICQAQDIKEDVVAEHLGDIWHAMIEEAWNTSAGSPRQERLIALLAALKSHPSPSKPAFKVGDGELWSNLPMFGVEMRSAWNWKREDEMWKYRNLSAFAARLTATGTFDFALYAIWAMRDALETSEPSSLSMSLESLVHGAAMWIEHAGNFIYQSRQVWEASPRTGDPAGGGALWKGTAGFSGERWALWKKRFGELAAADGLRPETKKLAERTATLMVEIENDRSSTTGR